MTLSTLLLYVAITALVLTLINVFAVKNSKSWIMSYAQNFSGVLFLVSGWVKAVDPLGTAYKMEDYFREFAFTFEPTWFGFLTPMFEYFGTIGITFSMVMIIFEILLGIMLILGDRPKWTAWMFFGLVLFFTFLTGFTYLTGYVQDGGNFFNFDTWGAYKKTNMKVQDCGCFGDFIKLEPKTSFFKDVFLLLPATFFILAWGKKHEWFTQKARNIILGLATVGLIFYCLNNFVWNIPHADFRPFKKGTDVAAVKQAEDDAAADVKITHWALENTNTGEKLTLPSQQYFKELKTYSKTNGWKVADQISTEPAIKPTKISAFEITDFDGNDVSYEYLDSEDYNFMILSYKMGYTTSKQTRTVMDSTFSGTDTIVTPDSNEPQIVKIFDKMVERSEDYYAVTWDPAFLEDYLKIIKPLAEKAKATGAKVSIVTGGADAEVITDFKEKTGIDADYYTADDILLKTIVRSNPGIVLWKDGKLLDKWHKTKLPSFEDIQSEHM